MVTSLSLSFLGSAALLLLVSIPACESGKTPEPKSRQKAQEVAQQAAKKREPQVKERPKPMPVKAKTVAARPVAQVAASPGDPVAGKFSLEDATKGLPGKGPLKALINTDKGKLECELYSDKAPITVANFVGLARGLRPWKDGDAWVKKPLYDGTVFHRVIKGFMIQGGDPAGNGSGGPGFVIPDEIWEGATHNERGLLCMANRGPNTNGSQFFIMDGAALHLDANDRYPSRGGGGYTIFGKCSPDKVIEALASVPTRGDRADPAPKIRSIKITR